MAGETRQIIKPVSMPMAMVIAGFLTLSVYISLEIYVFIYYAFRRHQGLYFWSMLSANSGIPLLSISGLLRHFELAPSAPMTIPIMIGWWLMVSGQALALYSRLHLVMHDPRKLRWVLRMVVIMFLVFQLPTSAPFNFNSFAE
jgi:hypothetical protein